MKTRKFDLAGPGFNLESMFGSKGLLSVFVNFRDPKLWIVIVLLILGSLSEGIGIAVIMPVITIATGEASKISKNAASLIGLFQSAGIPLKLAPLLLIMIGAILLKTALRFAAVVEANSIAANVNRDLRIKLLTSVTEASWSYFVRQPSGQLANVTSIEVDRIGAGIATLLNLVAAGVLTLFYLAMALWVSWIITAVAIVSGIVTFASIQFLVNRARLAAKVQYLTLQKLVGQLTELITNFKPLKAMATHASALPGLEDDAVEIARYRRREVISNAATQSIYEPLLAVLLSVGLYAALNWSTISLAELIFSAALFQRIMLNIGSLQTNYQQMVAKCQPSFAIVAGALMEADQRHEHWSGTKKVKLTREIRLDNVSFSYEQKLVLTRLSLTLRAGELTTLFGPSGSGKTTCVDLICCLYEPQAGIITVDDVPLHDIDLTHWRHQLGYVPQEPILFNATIAQNVSLGEADLGAAGIEDALRLAGAWEFVAAMPQGMNSLAGERGQALSGGQRQRIAIARALYRRPRLLILDEATSALDPEAEAAICETLSALKTKVTMLAISHQPAITTISDQVIHFGINKTQKGIARRGARQYGIEN